MPFTLDYRPRTFVDTVGQEHILAILGQQIKSWSAKSSYLFFWPRGTGKTTTARIMAKALNCQNLQEWNPCNSCTSCAHIDENKSLDFVEIDAASHTWVDNIREEIIDKALYPPTNLQRKIYIIDEVHMLSKWAFNALLKIMEEPPAYITFILATTEIHKIPDTIISRCQTFQFRHLTVEQLTGRLAYIAKEENINVEQEALTLIAKTAEWIMRDSIKYLEQVSVLGDVSVDHVSQYLGVVGDQQLEILLDKIRAGDFDDSLRFLEELYQSGIDLSVFSKQMLWHIDEHFSQDSVFMSAMTRLFAEINNKIKHMSQPLLAYKIVIHDHIHQDEQYTVKPQKATPQPVDSPQKKEQPTSETPTTQPDPTPAWHTKVADNTMEQQAQAQSISSISPEELKKQLISKVDTSAQSLMDKYVVIQEVSDNEVRLIAINKMAEISLKKDIEWLEKIVEEITWSSRKVSLRFMSKEDYFASLS